MGMAASQARLLCITARLHDVEYEAQAIQNAKVQLATQSDQVYNDYLEALDATTMTLTTMDSAGNKSKITANFNNLFSHSRVTPAVKAEYALRNENGMLVVEDDVYNEYYNFKNSFSDADTSPYIFALYMMGEVSDSDDIKDILAAEQNVYNKNADNTDISHVKDLNALYEKMMDLLGMDGTYTPDNIYDANYLSKSGDKEAYQEYKEALSSYQTLLYSHYKEDIYSEVTGESSDDFDTSLYNYYVSIYRQIEASGGCVSIATYNGNEGDAANNSEWLQAMIQSGRFSIELVSTDSKTGEVSFNGTSTSSDSNLADTATTEIDKTALAKAEAKYEYDLKQIDKKDKQYDLTLSKLETERTALTTEYESVQKVIEDNIDRTFGIFS